MKIPVPILCLLILCTVLLASGCTGNQTAPATPVPGTPSPAATKAPETTATVAYASNETLVAFVTEAAGYAKANGAAKAIGEFNNRNGSFVRGELYIYAYGFNGTTLAHPVNPETVGTIREGKNGVYVREMGESVRNGTGFYRFTYINPQHERVLESKMGYGVKIDDTWWIGSGVYTGPVEPATTVSPTAAGQS